MDALDHETWIIIPGHERYEASTQGLVRSWKVAGSNTDARADAPRILSALMWRGTTYYNLDGEDIALADIVAMTYGEDEALRTMTARERDLTAYDIREIRAHEGLKPAWDVAYDFRIDASRVRRIWDCVE